MSADPALPACGDVVQCDRCQTLHHPDYCPARLIEAARALDHLEAHVRDCGPVLLDRLEGLFIAGQPAWTIPQGGRAPGCEAAGVGATLAACLSVLLHHHRGGQ